MSESLMNTGEQSAQPDQAAEGQSVSTEATQGNPASPSAERPEWLPEKYNSPEDLANAYKALESKLGTKDEELRASILEELQQEAYGDRPDSAGDYQLPDSVDPETAVDSELMNWWSEHAFENGYSQEEFQKGIEMYVQATQSQGPDLESEVKRLGDNASARVESASAFASKFFPQDVMPAIERMCESAEGIMALEVIMEGMKDGSFSGGTSTTSSITADSLQTMMQDDRYHNPARRDSAFVKQVEEGFKKLYG